MATKHITPKRVRNMQRDARKRWDDPNYAKRHGTVSPELMARWNEEFPNSTWGDTDRGE